MNLDYKWLAEYLATEIERLRKIESVAKTRETEYAGKLEHSRAVLSNVTPKLDKLTEQWAILNAS